MKKIIIILSFILLVLILLLLVLNYLVNKDSLSSKKIFPTPTSFSNQSNINETEKTRQKQNEQLIPTIPISPLPKLPLDNIKTLSPEIIAKVQQIKKQLPFDTESFQIDFSYPLESFIIAKKSPQAEEKLKEFFNNNQISYEELLKLNLIHFTEKPLNEFKIQLENSYQKIQEKNNLTLPISPTGKTSLSYSVSSSSESINPLIELLNIFLNFGQSTSPSSNPISPTITQNELLTPFPSSPSSLNDIFNEVGQKVGVPPKILEAVMKIEMRPAFNLSPQQIADYSTPNHYWPGCGPNLCSATGPMQMTIGIDNNGYTNCPSCGAGFCPNAWASYGSTVNSFGGYAHQSNPCNIRDNVYGSAAKLKNDSGATDSLNWTQPEVYLAGVRYYGSCDDEYRYEILGNRTYCEYMWDYYMGLLPPELL